MSAPDTDLEKQKKRHFGPLAGIVAVLALVGFLFMAYLVNVAMTEGSQSPAEGAPAQGLPAEGAPVAPETQSDGAPSIVGPEQTVPAE